MRAFRVQVTSTLAYWSVLDDAFELVGHFDGFLAHLRLGRGRAEGTTRKYAEDLALFGGWLERTGRGLEDGARELHGFVLWLRMTPIERVGAGVGAPRSLGRVNQVLAGVREFYKHAVHLGVVPSAVLALLWEVGDDRFLPHSLRLEGAGLAYRAVPRHQVAAPRAESPDAATPGEVAALLAAAVRWRDRYLIVLMRFCGLRVGAVLGLRRSDVHLLDSSVALGCRYEGPHVHVVPRDNPNGAAAKRRSALVVPASWPVVETRDGYLSERAGVRGADDCDFEFVNLWHAPVGAPMSYWTVKQLFTNLSNKAGLARAVSPHMLRHSFGRSLSDDGVDLAVARDLLGHVSLESTMVYASASPERLRRAVDRLAGLAGGGR
jgi:site-specific recombinase XerD